MQKKECPNCAMDVDRGSKVCPICGYKFEQFSPAVKWTAIFLVILFFLYLIF